MMTIAELKSQRGTHVDAAKRIRDQYGDDLTAEQATQVTAELDAAEEIQSRIVQAEARHAMDARLDADIASLEVRPQPQTMIPDSKPVANDNIEKDPRHGFESHRQFLDAVMAVSKRRASGMAVSPIMEKHPGLQYLAAAGSDEQSTFADPYGGFLVPESFSPDLLSIGAEADPVAGRTTVVPMATPVVKIPARVDKTHTNSVTGGLRFYWRAESDTSSTSRMEVEHITLTANSIMGVAYATNELMSDSPQSFTALLETAFAEEFRSFLIDARLNGTGVGQIEGVNVGGGLVTVAKEGGQSADTIVGENIVKMRSRCWRYGNAIWMANHDTLPQLAAAELSGNSSDVFMFQPGRGIDVPDAVLGRPIAFTEYNETLGDKGDIVLVNWAEYLEGVYQPLAGAESIHVRFVENENTFRFTARVAGVPWWRAALTPKNSSNTLSPYVSLAARA